MDILGSLRRMGDRGDVAESKGTIEGNRVTTISGMLDAQIAFHESKIADLKAAKAAISPDVEKALNALAKL